MAKLEELRAGLQIEGIIPEQRVTVIDAKWHGTNAIELVYKRADGQPGAQLVFRNDEARLEIVEAGQRWDFSADGELFRLVAEAYRIHLAHLFDPVLAVHTSQIDPLPHQITGVYGEMLVRQPLRYLLADDPGAGKTIMAGLLIKELMVRGDVRRCLICVPGSLATQWQDELWARFQLYFDILTRETVAASVTGNPFAEHDLVIMRIDQVARSEELKEKLKRTDWDLIICDEAHKMAASFWGGELKVTWRYRLGQLLSSITRHFVLMTATPHNGKEEDFQLFLALIDPDRFEGRFREGVHEVDVSDIMRRMVKEHLRKFDGKPLFPERRAYTVSYRLSDAEMALYNDVTEYVREEFNRAEQIGDDSRKGTVGFALTILQRRLASSPEAIYQSLRRRRERLQKRLHEAEVNRRTLEAMEQAGELFSDEEYYDDLDEAPAEEMEAIEEQISDSATAALTIAELKAEIETLRRLEQMASQVRYSGTDCKWEQLAALIQENATMAGPNGRRKLVIFSEHRDTLNYLRGCIETLFGRDDNLVFIDGSLSREERREAEGRFKNEPGVHFLVATDAAGEGINLQQAHLMINYDLPWNPNRLEQRFGRIHRIGQNEVCHLWNLVAGETREGYVYERLLKKLESEGKALDGQVFDVLGKLFDQTPLRKLLVEAIRYGDRPDVRARLEEAVDNAVDRERVRELLEARSLVTRVMDTSQIEQVRAEMERYAARRLQPHYVKAFFVPAFELLGGSMREREPGRYRINHVPAAIRDRAKDIGAPLPVLREYERVCFEKSLITVQGQPMADFLCPGHPLLDAVIDLMLDKHGQALRSGAVLVDSRDPSREPRALFFLEQTLRDASERAISQKVHFVEIDQAGQVRAGGSAPYLDYRPATGDELAALAEHIEGGWLSGPELEAQVVGYAIETLVPGHLESVREGREALIDKTLAAVQERLTKEINYWDARAATLRSQEKAGKPNARLNSQIAQGRADELAARLARRKEELAQERQIAASPPVVIGGALVIPMGLLLGDHVPPEMLDTRITEAIAMQAVIEAEIALGNYPEDKSEHKLGYDIESFDPRAGRLRFIEVKGRRAGAAEVKLTRNEILTALNVPEQFILALVEIIDGQGSEPRYIRDCPFSDPKFAATGVDYSIATLLKQSTRPE